MYLQKNPLCSNHASSELCIPQISAFPWFCRTARIQGNQSKSLHKIIWKLNTLVNQKEVFFIQIFSKCCLQGSILVVLERTADHSYMFDIWTCFHWLHTWKVNKISVHHCDLCTHHLWSERYPWEIGMYLSKNHLRHRDNQSSALFYAQALGEVCLLDTFAQHYK